MNDLIPPLNAWLDVVRVEDIDDDALVTTTTNLIEALRPIRSVINPDAVYPNRILHPQFSEANHIIRAVIDLSGSFLWNNYTDSDTDAPCDIEWDVHHLQRDLDPAYIIPDDVEPAYVLATVYDQPEIDEDSTV